MRPLASIAILCITGAAVVTILAERRVTLAGEAPKTPRSWELAAQVSTLPSTAPSSTSLSSFSPQAQPSVRPPPATAPRQVDEAPLFGNTYYDFPVESRGRADTPLYTAHCALISVVPWSFHERLCVQGSGRLRSGDTVSFASRDCGCAAVCPRTGQHICYEVLDAARFPCGRGATGRPIVPLRTVAVDPSVIPLGTRLFIPELMGLPRPDGSAHDGCFVAEDQGLKVRGHRLDVFAGDEGMRRLWDAAVPSHRGVHVFDGAVRCAAVPPRPQQGCGSRRR